MGFVFLRLWIKFNWNCKVGFKFTTIMSYFKDDIALVVCMIVIIFTTCAVVFIKVKKFKFFFNVYKSHFIKTHFTTLFTVFWLSYQAFLAFIVWTLYGCIQKIQNNSPQSQYRKPLKKETCEMLNLIWQVPTLPENIIYFF